MQPTEAEASQPPSDVRARCVRHPESDASAICARCGAFICPACSGVDAGRVLCPACVSVAASGSASTMAVASGLLGAAGLCAAFVPGLVGLVLGEIELRRIARGESPRAGRHWAAAGRALGWLNVLLAALTAAAAALALS